MGHGRRSVIIMAAVVAFLAAALLWPLALMVGGAFTGTDGRPTAAHLAGVLADPVTLRGLGNSLLLAAMTTAIACALAIPLALLAVRTAFPGRGVLAMALLVPLVLPPFVGAIGVRHVLGGRARSTRCSGPRSTGSVPAGSPWWQRCRRSRCSRSST